MTLRVNPPVLNSALKCYTFTFEQAPSVASRSQRTWESIPFQEDTKAAETLDTFVDEFLAAATSYFSKPLSKSVFYQRLLHTWTTDEVDSERVETIRRGLTDGGTAACTWIPARILFYSTRYEMVWTLTDVTVEPPQIPPGFLEQEEAEVLASGATPAPATELPPLQEEEPPESALEAAPTLAQRARERQKVREARLRVALAKLRAERLAERYYRRYGNFDPTETDSELSSEEEASAAGAAGRS